MAISWNTAQLHKNNNVLKYFSTVDRTKEIYMLTIGQTMMKTMEVFISVAQPLSPSTYSWK